MLTLEQIKNATFERSGMKGYKADSVDDFIDEVIATVEKLEAEKADSGAEAGAAGRQVGGLPQGRGQPAGGPAGRPEAGGLGGCRGAPEGRHHHARRHHQVREHALQVRGQDPFLPGRAGADEGRGLLLQGGAALPLPQPHRGHLPDPGGRARRGGGPRRSACGRGLPEQQPAAPEAAAAPAEEEGFSVKAGEINPNSLTPALI